MCRILTGFLLVLCPLFSLAQVNGYAKVTAIVGNVLTLSNGNQTYDSFVAGEQVLIIQMQGADITGNTSNNSSFGILSSLNSAGLYEFGFISSVGPGLISITLTSGLVNTYDVLSGLQVVTFPTLGVSGFTTTANIPAVNWDGNIGGVTAFKVQGNLTLNHNITADGAGFRGGGRAGQDGSTCESTTWRTTTGNAKYSDKGEGVHIATSGQRSGKAKIVNGGGGGIVHNGGGGGGANYTTGGDGYYGFPGDGCGVATNAGGQGGLAITSNASRVFFGGGGGGGQENNSVGTDGGNGGGIIMIKCDTIVLTGACSSHTISANGDIALDSGRDGSGGAGAGGSLVLDVKGLRVKTGCPLLIAADGGNGGNVIHFDTHGSGGGGGQGTIYLRATTSMSNVTLSTNFGLGGFADTLSSPPRAGSGGGPANAGIFTGAFTSPLPIKLLNLQATETDPRVVEVTWQTATENNSKSFEVLHSVDGKNWKCAGLRTAAGESQKILNYSFTHFDAPYDINYYRLKEIDIDGRSSYSDIVAALVPDRRVRVTLYPNPAKSFIFLECERDISNEELFIVDAYGRRIRPVFEMIDSNRWRADVRSLPSGIYFVCSQNIREKLILE